MKAIHLSADGELLFAAGSDDGALAVFARHPASGLLAPQEVHEDGVDGVFGLLGVCGVAASPDGRNVYAVSEFDDSLVVFSRDASTDRLSFLPEYVQENRVGGVFGLDGPCGVAVSPDDSQVFVAARADDALTVFSRDASTDELTLADVEFDGLAPLHGASDVAISPDSRHVYVAAESGDAIAVFVRNLATGQIGFVQAIYDDAGGVDGIDGASSVTISPDGRNVYATGRVDDAVAAFSRDQVTGALTFQGAIRNGEGGVNHLRAPSAAATDPSGAWVLVASRDDHAVAVFRRLPGNGALVYEGSVRNDVGGVDGIEGAIAVAATSEQVYAAGYKSDAIAIFGLPGDCVPVHTDGFESGDFSAWSAVVP